jgi:hypothetical protein
MVKRMLKKEKMLNEYILLSCTFAVVTSAVRGTTGPPVAVVLVRYSLHPKTHPLVWLYSHHLASIPIAEVSTNCSVARLLQSMILLSLLPKQISTYYTVTLSTSFLLPYS